MNYLLGVFGFVFFPISTPPACHRHRYCADTWELDPSANLIYVRSILAYKPEFSPLRDFYADASNIKNRQENCCLRAYCMADIICGKKYMPINLKKIAHLCLAQLRLGSRVQCFGCALCFLFWICRLLYLFWLFALFH